ncbi:MAG: NAD(P)-binding protein [Actinobacteria bacterium]|nr:NAD(P)-binding protein [Actinomycetota bacterium]
MGEKIVVGAGLAGLCAAINLRREGHEVRVLERRDGIGGPARDMSTGELTYVMADGTPMEVEKISRYIGIDVAPAFVPLHSTRIYSFGKRFDIPFPKNVPAVLVERGSRKDSMDMYLYRIAVDDGVQFEFNYPVKTRKDFDDLPPQSIIAAGLFEDAYRELGIPYVHVEGLFGQGMVADDYDGPNVILYMDRHTQDYAFFSTIHGLAGALLFQRKKPLSQAAKDWFPEQLAKDEGIEFPEWHNLDVGVLPMGSINNPRLFHEKFILAGTLAGAQDPVLLFGVHGALVTGKIAAMALSRPEEALRQFRKINLLWKLSYLNRLFIELTHPYGLMAASRVGLELYPLYARFVMRYTFLFVPGWLRV